MKKVLFSILLIVMAGLALLEINNNHTENVKILTSSDIKKCSIRKIETQSAYSFGKGCPACEHQERVIKKLSKRNQIKYHFIDVDTSADFSNKYGISDTPEILIFRNKKVKYRHVGFMDKNSILKLQNQS
jgi:thiol-disulfide isomerase/thioredoxin